jgi:hypothetical protein
MTTLKQINEFRPFINGCKSPEPQLREMLAIYYQQAFPRTKALELADEYIRALKKHLNSQDPLGEALNSGDGSYRP